LQANELPPSAALASIVNLLIIGRALAQLRRFIVSARVIFSVASVVFRAIVLDRIRPAAAFRTQSTQALLIARA
jgi:hypothetical protein